MSVADLVLVSCLIIHGGGDCLKHINACVEERRAGAVKEFVKKQTDAKASAEDMLSHAPQGDWSAWVLDCAKKEKK